MILMLRAHRIFSIVVSVAALVAAFSASAAKKAAPVTEPVSAGIEQRVSYLEQMLQNQGLIDMLQQIQSLQKEIADLRGQIEINHHELAQLQEQQRNLYSDIDHRLQKLEGKTVSTTGPAPATAPPLETITPVESATPAGSEAETALTMETVTPEVPATAADAGEGEEVTPREQAAPEQINPVEAQAHYQEAFRLLKQGEYDKAISAFNAFLGNYPQSQYSENAQYWMAEAFFVTRRYNEAITEYMELVSNYPQSQKAANSLLKIGVSYYELGQKEEGRKVLKDLIERYPGTTAAQDAETRLKRDHT